MRILIYYIVFSSILACSDSVDLPMTIEEEELIEISQFRFLALGDSYTIGEGIELTNSWPFQLSRQLAENNIVVDDTKIIAQTGWTTRNLINAIEMADLDSFDLVSLSIGVNNQFQRLSFDVFKDEFNILLSKAKTLSTDKNQVFVVSIPDYGVTPFGASSSQIIGQEIDMYNNYIKAQCLNMGVQYIDVTEISRMLGDSNNALASDRLHPSVEQYAQWVNAILPTVLSLLE